MWRDYFGPNARIFGVDINEACKACEKDGIRIFIGDQEDPAFWAEFKENVEHLDVVIDDGGHTAEQQRVTFDQLLPHLRRGGVYCCEDIHGAPNQFTAYMHALTHRLNTSNKMEEHPNDDERRLLSPTIPFQATVNGIHFYPYVIVLEKNDVRVPQLVAPKKGTVWDHQQ